MSEKLTLIKRVVLIIGFILLVGSAGCSSKKYCAYPGCDNIQVADNGTCYKHFEKTRPKSYNIIEKNYSKSTYNKYSEKTSDSYSTNNNVSNYIAPKSSGNTEKFKTYDVEDYDNPDDYASDFADDYAYDEFGDDDSAYAYDYGYEAAYEHWMDEMGE